jgi:hypothetical protein
MELTTIEMPEEEAKEAAAAYRAAVREHRDEEDAMLATAYRELAKGQRLIKLSEVIAAAGVTRLDVPSNRRYTNDQDKKLTVRVPRLAICRAHCKHAWTDGVDEDGALRIQGKRTVADRNSYDVVRFPDGTFPAGRRVSFRSSVWETGISCEINAMVPNVPPPLRPAHSLKNYHLLWEADWSFAPGPPPGDPALLKRIGGDLYAVLAVWDLSEIERAVLSGRPLEA